MSLNPRKHEAFNPARDLRCDDSFTVPLWLDACGLLSAASPSVAVSAAVPVPVRKKYTIAAKTSCGKPLRGGFARIAGIDGRDIFCAGNEKGELYFFELRAGAPAVTGRIALTGTIVSRPLFHEGLLYCATAEGILYAIRTSASDQGGPLRNSIEWQKRMKKGIMTAPAALPGVVLVTPLDGFYALASGTVPGKAAGTALWGASISGTMSTPCIHENTILIGTEDRRLMAFDCGSGRLAGKWECELGAPCRTTPAFAETAAVVSAMTIDGTLYCAGAEDGRRRWNFRSGSPAPGGVITGIYSGSECFLFGTESGTFYCIDTNGRKAWEYAAAGSIRTEPFFHEGMVFFGAGTGALVCLDVSSGREVCVLGIEGELSAKPVIAGDVLVFGTNAGHICVALPE